MKHGIVHCSFSDYNGWTMSMILNKSMTMMQYCMEIYIILYSYSLLLVLYHLHTSPMCLFQSKSQDRQVCFIVQKYYLRQPFFLCWLIQPCQPYLYVISSCNSHCGYPLLFPLQRISSSSSYDHIILTLYFTYVRVFSHLSAYHSHSHCSLHSL